MADPPQVLGPWRKNLRSYDLEETHIGFVYFLCKGDSVVYVGQTTNIGQRITQHRSKKQKDFDSVWFIKMEAMEMNHAEKAFIKALRPHTNCRESQAEPTNSDWVKLAELGRETEDE